MPEGSFLSCPPDLHESAILRHHSGEDEPANLRPPVLPISPKLGTPEPPVCGVSNSRLSALFRAAGEELFSLEKLPFVDVFLIIETIRLPSSTKTNRIASKQRQKRLLPPASRLYQCAVNIPLQGTITHHSRDIKKGIARPLIVYQSNQLNFKPITMQATIRTH
jgi:hypothetical protein